MEFLNVCLGISTLFLPLFLYRAFLWFLTSEENTSSVKQEADVEVMLAQG